MSGRLARGRGYARAGQVLDFELAQGKVTAQVQGSRVRPYQVRIGVLPLTTAQWRRVQDRLAGQALFRAKLLAGEMPHEIEEVFAELRHAAVSPAGQRPGHAVQLPRLGGAVQASRRGLLRPGRGVRPRSVRHAGLAREEQARAPRGAAAASGHRPGPGGGSGPAAAGLRGRVLVRPAEPGPAAGSGHGVWAVRPGPAAPHVPAPAGQGQGRGAGRHPAARLPGAGRRTGRAGTARR